MHLPGTEIRGERIFELPLGTYLRQANGTPIGRILDYPSEAEDGGSRVVILNPEGKRVLLKYWANYIFRCE